MIILYEMVVNGIKQNPIQKYNEMGRIGQIVVLHRELGVCLCIIDSRWQALERLLAHKIIQVIC